jgi:hypothetical protein
MGAIVFVIAAVSLYVALRVSAQFGADPACRASITLRTPPRSGPTCVIYAGSVGRVYSLSGTRDGHRQYHVVFISDGRGPVLDVELQDDFQDRVSGQATPGDQAVVETVNGAPAYIATPAGSATAGADPRAALVGSRTGFIVGAFMLCAGILLRSLAARQ